MDENLCLGGVCNMHVGFFYLEHVKVIRGHLGSFGAHVWKVGRKSKTAHCRAKRTKILASGVYVTCCWYLWLWTCQCHLGSFGALFRNVARNSKTACRRVKQGRKFGPQGCMYHAYWYFCPWTCQGHLGSFGALFQKLGRNSKTAYRRAKRTKIGVIQCTFRKKLLSRVIITDHHRVKRMKIAPQRCMLYAHRYF